MANPQFSICIPAYDMGGKGSTFLDESLRRLVAQDFDDMEVIVSDQSETDAVANCCAMYARKLEIRRVDYRSGKRQASANTNNAMRAARGTILKILFQDDFLARNDALSLIAKKFDEGADWVLCGSAKTRDGTTAERPMVPNMNPNIHFGKNTVSSPSVLALRAGQDLFFDEALIWLMDVDFYKRCIIRFGQPSVCAETLILNRLHAGQVSATVNRDLKRHELAYIRAKYRSIETFGNALYYYKQVLKAR